MRIESKNKYTKEEQMVKKKKSKKIVSGINETMIEVVHGYG